MEAASDFPATSNEGPKTLEEALDKIRALYKRSKPPSGDKETRSIRSRKLT